VQARNGAVKIHYESTGIGVPVLLIMGLGMTVTAWWRTVPVLAEGLRVLAFDNRGVGRSDRARGPYSLAQMADDAVAVLDAAQEERAHVYGISLGGMIAQELAIRHPARVRSVVFGATSPGGQQATGPDSAVQAFFARRAGMPAEEAAWASVPYNYGAATRERHAQRIAEDIAQRLQFRLDPASYLAQLSAGMAHDACPRLGQITGPALVVHGGEDRMMPPANAQALVQALPDARLELWDGAGHLYMTDEPRADRAILRFLLST
jgi:pimeloyl-ACP methyl ester carboxylesterase